MAPGAVDGAASAPGPIIYAGSGRDYSIVLKAEAGRVFLMAATVRAYCGNTELDFESTGRSFYSGILEPKELHRTRRGLVGGEGQIDEAEVKAFSVVANFERGELVGKLRFELSEEAFHCTSGGDYGEESGIAFRAKRHAPVGDSGPAVPRANRELPTYFDSRGPFEVLLRVPRHLVSVRGSVVSRCFKGRGRIPLFGSIQVLRRSENGRFGRRVERQARSLGHGIHVDEAISIHGHTSRTAIDGTYQRVRSRRRGTSVLSRCSTGPLHFHAARYLPAGQR